MRASPRALVVLALSLAGAAAGASHVGSLLAAVEAEERFAAPAIATGTLIQQDGAGETRHEIRIAGRRSTLRVDVGATHALVRGGKALVRGDDATTHLTDEATIAGTNVRYGDLSVFTARALDIPQIVDEGPAGTVVAAAPAGTSPYALLVVTIDPARSVRTEVKYYEHAVNNLVKRDGRSDFADVAGTLRPGRITMWDVQGSGTTEIVLEWHAAPALGRAPFTPAGLATALGG
jgi:hypothetical protein